ncbi:MULTISPECIES: outer membrane protein assembly factor BamD [Microbacterium]|jgi:hypothetical protein|uniref:hypothetical protein n=1 Tax=Microbacterium TaxID=33882 RepID=UPI000AD86521|nr:MULTISPECIES: hypothetical protein [unclassified Microbacterium]MBN9198173.1 hypothetical protein [Microbacterium ginsengisoli]
MRRTTRAVIMTIAALALAGCASPSPSPAAALQALVADAADQAQSGDYAGATATIDDLENQVAADRSSGRLSTDRADAIDATIALVRADIAALTAPASPTPRPTSTTVSTGGSGNHGDNGSSGNNGNGKGKGKGGG